MRTDQISFLFPHIAALQALPGTYKCVSTLKTILITSEVYEKMKKRHLVTTNRWRIETLVKSQTEPIFTTTLYVPKHTSNGLQNTIVEMATLRFRQSQSFKSMQPGGRQQLGVEVEVFESSSSFTGLQTFECSQKYSTIVYVILRRLLQKQCNNTAARQPFPKSAIAVFEYNVQYWCAFMKDIRIYGDVDAAVLFEPFPWLKRCRNSTNGCTKWLNKRLAGFYTRQ